MSHLEPEAKIFACSQSVYLAENSEQYGIPLGKVTMSKYSDGEFQPSYEESIREYVYLFVPLSKFR
jgi:ribose-phosphate pyrophosphokinase